MLKTGADIWPIAMLVMGQLMPHFTIEYRNHFTDFHATVIDMVGGFQIGATEQLLLMYGF